MLISLFLANVRVSSLKIRNENHIKLLEWPGNSPDPNSIKIFVVCLKANTLHNGLYLKGKADSGSNSSVVQVPPNLKRLFKIGRLNAQMHQNAS